MDGPQPMHGQEGDAGVLTAWDRMAHCWWSQGGALGQAAIPLKRLASSCLHVPCLHLSGETLVPTKES